ncbi:hypothetical protein LTR06_011228 [Exophiala xenobiotica]|nr:hypothetical protein LTR06_011228 [Exophiala xenobiotica]
MASDPSAKKFNACVPCHQRKVRCDLNITGTPCSRCLSKNRNQYCIPVTRKQRNTGRRQQSLPQPRSPDNTLFRQSTTNLQNSDEAALEPISETVSSAPSNAQSREQVSQEAIDVSWGGRPQSNSASRLETSQVLIQGLHAQPPSIPGSATTPSFAPNDTPVSEEDAQVQTLYRMGEEDLPTNISNPTLITKELRVFEYFDRFSSVSVLGQALGRRQRKRLVQIDLLGSESQPNDDNEIAGLDPADLAYLTAKNVFELPSTEIWYVQPA